jgi:uncharacterized membrane protein (UPF0182 family)
MKRWPFIVAILFLIFLVTVQLYPNYLWFDAFGLNGIWIKELQSKFLVFGFGFGIALLWLITHVTIANRNCKKNTSEKNNPIQTGIPLLDQFFSQLQQNVSQSQLSKLSRKAYRILKVVAVIMISLFFGMLAKSHWDIVILFFNQSPFGTLDPIFNQDISFYLFSIPFFKAIQGWSLTLITISLIAIFCLYLSENLIPALFTKQRIGKGIQRHVLFLLGMLLIIVGVGSWLGRYDLLFTSSGVVHGIGYTDHHIRLPMLSLLSIGYAVLGLLIWAWSVFPLKKLPLYVGVGLIIIQLFGNSIIPGIVQNYSVQPNEIVKEKPYIINNINFTRQAYGLNHITDEQFPVSNTLTLADIQSESLTMSNIRLWNREPLKQTFSQLQEIRLYYEFGNIDVDRYMINGRLQQVMLSPRELDISQLTSQAQTWTNQHLVYTHGYGVCMSPVNEVTREGLPKFYIKDLPPVSPHMIISRPEIYFGEKANNYVLVNTLQKEFDYPKGDKNVYTHYQGTGGVQITGFLRRLVYALKFSDMKILASSLITSKSRLLYDREITKIVKKITPFIALDNDPYLIVSGTGRLVWMLDGYTFSSNFPYSEPFNRKLNYLRNAVKITIDAYDGAVNYYIIDREDPIIRAYSQFYTSLFKPLSEMPADLL